MATQIDIAQREVVLIEEAHIRPMMGLDILEPLPSARIPYPMVDPYILVHEAVVPITRSARAWTPGNSERVEASGMRKVSARTNSGRARLGRRCGVCCSG